MPPRLWTGFRGGRGGRGSRGSHTPQRGRHEGKKQSRNGHANLFEGNEEPSLYESFRRRLRRQPGILGLRGLKETWTLAIDVLASEEDEIRQKAFRKLIDEDGLAHVGKTLNEHDHYSNGSDFLDMANVFLQVITHPYCTACLSLDTDLGTLYHFISGANGSRALSFFNHIVSSLADNPNPQSEETVRLLLTALHLTLMREQRVQVNSEIPPLIKRIEDLASHMGGRNSFDDKIAIVRRIVERAHGQLEPSKLLPSDKQESRLLRSTYPRSLEAPGHRHDNDMADISLMQVIPTENEMLTDKDDFLPSSEFTEPHHLQGMERLLDVHYRLLRHDIFAECKRSISILYHALDDSAKLQRWIHSSDGDKSMNVYQSAGIKRIDFTQREGLRIMVSFRQPERLLKMGRHAKEEWWKRSRRLERGNLLCLVFAFEGKKSTFLLTVDSKETRPDKYDNTLVPSYGPNATIAAKSITALDKESIEKLMRATQYRTSRGRGFLIEFPRVIPATFLPVLMNLQRIYQEGNLPFAQWIVPDVTGHRKPVPPPMYARAGGFVYDLQAISKGGKHLTFKPGDTSLPVLQEIEDNTTLDKGQVKGLVAALSREFCNIQGPPGTGKTYLGVQIMRVLLANKAKADLGPVVVVCYTNHALDQFLEHIEACGVRKIIRVGRKSSSAVLEGKNLSVISRESAKTASEKYELWSSYKAREQTVITVQRGLKRLGQLRKPFWTAFASHLAYEHPKLYEQFSRVEEGGFHTQGKKEPFEIWAGTCLHAEDPFALKPGSIASLLDKAGRDIWALETEERAQLLSYLIKEIEEDAIKDIVDELHNDEKGRSTVRNVHDEVDRRALRDADVIGITTSGLASKISVLTHVGARVVVCEEAGEVLEAHMLSTFIPSIQHMIQIGDHQQLRPQIANFSLSMESDQGKLFQLDRSQFERMTLGEPGLSPFPFVQLNIQRRMRPAIARLVRNTLYPELIDDKVTQKFPDVIGLRRNLIWFDHEVFEDHAGDADGLSKSNSHEVQITVALVRHIVRQGVYNSKDIAVLTPYVGQLVKLRDALNADFEVVLGERDEEQLAEEDPSEEEIAAFAPTGKLQRKRMSELIRVATVDNFQGEEAKVIVVSLVRSNDHQKVGFLRTPNRINVLLSRAKHGMYLIGNSKTYANVPMWSDVLAMLREDNCVQTSFDLRCPRHPTIEIRVRSAADFDSMSPEGGCQEACDRRLDPCGHKCQAKCHSELMHKAFWCNQPCERIHDTCSHPCPRICGDPCGLCMVRIKDVELPCGHVQDLYCHQTQHVEDVKCMASVVKKRSTCGHLITAPCSVSVESPTFVCPESCKETHACGHKCPGSCGSCNPQGPDEESEHRRCTKVCGRKHGTCNHSCGKLCHGGTDCGPCELPCEVKCSHSKCSLKCHEACIPCIQGCTWHCEHQGSCLLPCSAPCVRLPCSKRCTKTLPCEHQCPGICGEPCPTQYCQICSGKGEARVDMMEFKTYNEIDLNETPIVALTCGHFFTAETLDGHFSMTEHYQVSALGEYIGIRPSAPRQISQYVPRCPDCQAPVLQHATHRYNRILNEHVMDESIKRLIASGERSLQQYETKLVQLQEQLEQIREAKCSPIAHHCKTLYESTKQLHVDIVQLIRKVEDKNQPVKRLYDATVRAVQRARSVGDLLAQLSLEDAPKLSPDSRLAIKGKGLRIKLYFFTIEVTVSVLKMDGNTSPEQWPLNRFKKIFERADGYLGASVLKSFPKVAVEISLCYAQLARLLQTSLPSAERPHAMEWVSQAKAHLSKAENLCDKGFMDADRLRAGVVNLTKVLQSEWYENVSKEEIEAIKAAMVSGPRGLATHSGHWYNCENGHPFAVGECGMPMQQARCPECGSPVGGRNHAPAAGVSRAMEMED